MCEIKWPGRLDQALSILADTNHLGFPWAESHMSRGMRESLADRYVQGWFDSGYWLSRSYEDRATSLEEYLYLITETYS